MTPSLTRYISSFLGLETKPDGGWQRNYHLLYPQGNSVNYYIPRNYGALEYTNIDVALSCNVIKYDNLQSVHGFFSFIA